MKLGGLRERGGIGLLGAIVFALIAVPAAAGETLPDPAAPMYRQGVVDVIELELPQASIEALEADPEGDYQPGTFSLARTDGTPDGVGAFSTPVSAEIRLKGSGSFLPLGEKAGFKIKFAKSQPFLGLRKMTLNNMSQDDSMVREALAYQAFDAMGVPAPRTGFAELLVNGEDYGLHLNIESLDKVALEKRFGAFDDPQHLYEAEYHADVTPDQKDLFEVDEGDEDNRGDLEALVTAASDTATDWSDHVAPFADLNEMTRMWAVEKYLGQWDGYSGMQGSELPSNYYLYSDPAGTFQMFPWGTDQTWSDPLEFDSAAGVLFDDCLQDTSCEAQYRQAASDVLATIPALDLDAFARCTAERLRPWQEGEPSSMQPNDAARIAESVQDVREFIAFRPDELAAWLDAEAPAPPPDDLPCPPYPLDPEDESPQGPSLPSEAGPALTAPAAATPPKRVTIPQPRRLAPLRWGRIATDGRVLRVRLKVPVAGRLELVARTGAKGRGPSVCGGHATARTAGSTLVSCALRASARQRLELHSLGVTLSAIFRTKGGQVEQVIRPVKLVRQ